MTDITELAQSLKAAAEKAGIEQWVNNHGEVNTADYDVDGGMYIDHICDCEIVGTESPRAEFIALANPENILALVEALEKAQQRIAKLESRAVKPPDELSGETLLDVASRTDLVYSDDTGILEYTNINECVVKVTAPPDKVIRFRCSNKRIYMRLVDRVKTHEHAGIVVDFPKNYKDFIQ